MSKFYWDNFNEKLYKKVVEAKEAFKKSYLLRLKRKAKVGVLFKNKFKEDVLYYRENRNYKFN